MSTTDNFRPADGYVIAQQIGRMNIMAISGGRVTHRLTGISLPVASGYAVTVDLDGNDTYVVRRTFKRGPKVWTKGEQRGVYCDQVGEAAYQASCFRDGDWGQA